MVYNNPDGAEVLLRKEAGASCLLISEVVRRIGVGWVRWAISWANGNQMV